MDFNQFKQQLNDYFNLSADLEDEQQARQSIVDGVSFRGSNIIILILAIFIASLGLNTNSPAVIIGAMLISPLMGPIIGIGLGAGTYDFSLIKRSARNLVVASLFSVATATLYFLISPVSEGHSELLARTSPSIYDVLIGFFGGAAGIVAIACRNKGNVIPGVAIATALMPPLCTAGYGLATWQLSYFFGAFYLFLINSIFIAFATLIGVKIFKYKPVNIVDPTRRLRIKRVVTIVVVLTLIPSVYLTVMMIRDSLFQRDANTFIAREFQFPNTQVFSRDVYTRGWGKYMDVTLIGNRLDVDSLRLAMLAKMEDDRLLKGTQLSIKQGITLNDAVPVAAAPGGGVQMEGVFATMMKSIDARQAAVDSLNAIVRRCEALDSLSYDIAPEIRVLYPSITHIALSRMMMCDVDTRRIDTLNVAIITASRPVSGMNRVKEYLETRTGLRDIHILKP